ncbi:hypothetical protein DL89DRAFT_128956 [Linderina pennispora]|uniref:Secreted protein n=1 Tax=Linderina pennispora TaxID=61395 RepID=A0A1Y1WEB1_9FUNG|nr:uncharacterized protein DL89DRAFT_128956 [Linderina pennispora]ORX71586.1 hypothetical protein DL89DRAFT_128956 [Linderina pennispora]
MHLWLHHTSPHSLILIFCFLLLPHTGTSPASSFRSCKRFTQHWHLKISSSTSYVSRICQGKHRASSVLLFVLQDPSLFFLCWMRKDGNYRAMTVAANRQAKEKRHRMMHTTPPPGRSVGQLSHMPLATSMLRHLNIASLFLLLSLEKQT